MCFDYKNTCTCLHVRLNHSIQVLCQTSVKANQIHVLTYHVLQDSDLAAEEEELNSAQRRVLDRTMAQLDAAKHGIQIVNTFLKECAEPQPVFYILAGTVLGALQEYFKSQRQMASKIFEVRLCSMSPEESGISYVIARYLLREGTSVDDMRKIRATVMKSITKFPALVRRLEVESADGEHFKMLWQMAEHPQSAYELWEENDAWIDALRKKFIEESGRKSLCTSAKVDLKTKYFKHYITNFGCKGAFTFTPLPRARTAIRQAVENLGFGSNAHYVVQTANICGANATAVEVGGDKKAAETGKKAADCDEEISTPDSTSLAAAWYGCNTLGKEPVETWDALLRGDLAKYGVPEVPPIGTRIVSGADIQEYLDLHHKMADHTVGYADFEEAVSRQHFHLLAKEAQSKSRVSITLEQLASSAFNAGTAGDERGRQKIQAVLDLLEGAGEELTVSSMIEILMEVLDMDDLQEVIAIVENLRFGKLVWLPQRDSILCKTLCKHEDFFHKLKRVMSSVRLQRTSTGKKALKREQSKPLLDKEKLLAIAKKNHKHKAIREALTGTGSDPMDPFAQSRMFVSKTFHDDVEAEDPNLALCLRTIGEWYEAFDSSGLTGRERARRMSNMHELFDAVLGSHWYCHKKPPSNIAGMPLRLWFALAANCDSADVLVNVKLDPEAHAMAGQKRRHEHSVHAPFKIPRLAEGTSAPAHTYIRAPFVPVAAPTQRDEKKVSKLVRRLKDKLLKFRYKGTYDLEGGFSSLVMMVGYKPAIQVALGVLKKAQTLNRIRLMGHRGFWFYRSKRARYDYFVGRTVRGRSLVDEWFGKMGFAKHSKRDQQRDRTLMKDVTLHARAYSKRSSTVKRTIYD